MNRYKPRRMRTLRHEIASLGLVAAVPLALAVVFPYGATGFRARKPAEPHAARCAFVSLDAAEESAALQAARTAWQVDRSSARGLRADLSSSELPPAPPSVVYRSRPAAERPRPVAAYAPDCLPPTAAARPPARLDAGKDVPPVGKLAFPRDELLKLD